MFSMKDLEMRTGMSRRTIRYYVEKGLIDPPRGKGRGAYYTLEHLERLTAIKAMTDRGMPFVAVEQAMEHQKHDGLDGMVREDACDLVYSQAQPRVQNNESTGEDLWSRYRIGEGLELHVKPGVLTPHEVKEAEKRLRELLRDHRKPRQGELLTDA